MRIKTPLGNVIYNSSLQLVTAETIWLSFSFQIKYSRADVEKHRMNSNIKRQQMDDSKNEYANQLQKTNELQVDKQTFWFLPISDRTPLGSC